MTPDNDDTTRYLCAASYLDPGYSTRAITEFLVEPTRPVPPSPGLDAGRVLTEAVRARARRKNYDALLLLVTVLIIGLAWDTTLLYAWIAVSLLASLATTATSTFTTKRLSPKVIIGGVAAIVLIYLAIQYLPDLLGAAGGGYSDLAYSTGFTTGSQTARWVIAGVLALIVLGITAFERWTLWQLLTTYFSRGAHHAQDTGSLTGFLTEDFREQLGRYHRAAQTADLPGAPLIVYRGYNPFVGAGFRRDAWSMAIPLEKLPDDELDDVLLRPLTTESLYTEIRAALEKLRKAGPLSPDRRLGELTVTDAVFTPATELIDHLATPEAAGYLPSVNDPPNSRLTTAEVEELRREPREWARYYLCVQVETWDRDLVLTTFLHLAVDETTLYLEWTPFMLPPIRAGYRVVDRMRPDSLRPLAQGLLQWLQLPASLPGRLAHLASWIRSPKREPGMIDADRYGAAHSLRELASVNQFADYFQLVDIERYEKIIGSRLLPTIGKLLDEAGFSTAKFDEQASVVINNDITIGGDNNAPLRQSGFRPPRRPAGKSQGAS